MPKSGSTSIEASSPKLGRRRLLAAVLGSGLMAPAVKAQPSMAGPNPKPATGGGKFYPTGQVREWPGNTIICPVEPDTALHDVLRRVQEEAMAEPVMRKFTLLPTSSLHMTLFEGVDLDHRVAPYWPTSVPVDAPLNVVNQWCRDRLASFHTGGGRFHMRPDPALSAHEIRDFTLPLRPADAQEERHMRDMRDRLASLLEIRAPNHAAYRFHITLGYLIERLTADEAQQINQLYKSWFARIEATVPEFVIGPPAFCTFKDMFAFAPVLALSD